MKATMRPLQLARGLDHELDAIGTLVVDATAAYGFREVPDHGPGHTRQVAQVAGLSPGRGHLRRRHDASPGEGRPPPGLSPRRLLLREDWPAGEGVRQRGKKGGARKFCPRGWRERESPPPAQRLSAGAPPAERRSSARSSPPPPTAAVSSGGELRRLLPGAADPGWKLQARGEGARVLGAGRRWLLAPSPERLVRESSKGAVSSSLLGGCPPTSFVLYLPGSLGRGLEGSVSPGARVQSC